MLRNFIAGLDIGRPELTPARATAEDDGTVRVAFTAKLPVTGLGIWTYRSGIPVWKRNGTWKVDWSLSLVHPHLSDTAKFHLEREDAPVPKVTDRNGTPLTGEAHPSLRPVPARLVDRVTGEIEGTEASFGKKGGQSSEKPTATTLDATWQAAADKALADAAGGRNASLVALRVGDGEILAMASSPATGFNRAFSGTYAPAPPGRS